MKIALFAAIALVSALVGKSAVEDDPGYGIVLIIVDALLIYAFWA